MQTVESKMPTTELTKLPEQAQQQLAQPQGALLARLTELRDMPVSQVTASVGQELIQDAKKYIGAVHQVFDEAVDAAFKAHRSMTALRAKFLKPGEDAEVAGRNAIRSWENERQRRIQAQRIEQERLARLEAEKRRQEELAHMQAQSVPTEIIEQRAADPLVVAPAQVDEDKGKVEGASTVERYVGEVTAATFQRFVRGIIDNPALLSALLELRQTALNQYLTRTKGQAMEGVTIKRDFIVRSKANG